MLSPADENTRAGYFKFEWVLILPTFNSLTQLIYLIADVDHGPLWFAYHATMDVGGCVSEGDTIRKFLSQEQVVVMDDDDYFITVNDEDENNSSSISSTASDNDKDRDFVMDKHYKEATQERFGYPHRNMVSKYKLKNIITETDQFPAHRKCIHFRS